MNTVGTMQVSPQENYASGTPEFDSLEESDTGRTDTPNILPRGAAS